MSRQPRINCSKPKKYKGYERIWIGCVIGAASGAVLVLLQGLCWINLLPYCFLGGFIGAFFWGLFALAFDPFSGIGY